MRAPLPLLLATLLAAGGCVVHTYQPLSGLHRPVVVDPTAHNFDDVNLTVHCVVGEALTVSDANALCRRLAVLFENQGAFVVTTLGGPPEEEDQPPEPRPLGLTLEVRARRLHAATHPLTWAATIASFSLVPAITEFTFEQELTVRDDQGFLLATDALRGKMTHWYGFGSWASNTLLDYTVREDEDEIVGDHADRALSTDLYRQLSQSVFDAKMQSRVLRAGVIE